ncbi:sulfatase-like hydrolase/transferase [Flavobacteriaceae bacterium]|nr:sulfatase-like hydrolase/transferase [Flavobacteriaceae bacterium]
MFKKLLLSFSLALVSNVNMQAQTDPNIIFFIVDDLGYMDLNCYVEDQDVNDYPRIYSTPNIDTMADDGIRFTHAYEAAPRCAASRTSIMSGKYESRPSVSGGLYLGTESTADNPEGYAETTWAQALKDNGYKTFFIGKWHLGHDNTHWPDDFGFDINIAGDDHGAPESYWYPYGSSNPMDTAEGTGAVDLSASRHQNYIGAGGAGTAPASGEEDEYLTHRITWEVEDFIENHVASNDGKTEVNKVPFLAMVSHYGVHTPLEAPAADITTFQTKINGTTFSGSASERDITTDTKMHQDNATYAAMIKSIDDSLGDIRAKLVTEGIDDNTIIIITSDNGGKSTKEMGKGVTDLPTSNRPLRGGKTWLLEGGIRLPLIVYGPDYRGSGNPLAPVVEDTPVIGTDFFPTMLEMAGAALLTDQHLDGESFEDLLLTSANGGDNTWTKTKSLVWDFNYASSGTANVSMAGVRSGDYKLLEFKYNNTYELYNVVTDMGETSDLSGSNLALVEQLKDTLFSYRTNAGVTHRVTNSNFITTNKELYDNANTITGSDIQASTGCAAAPDQSIIFNGTHECWFDLDWAVNNSNGAGSKVSDPGAGDAKSGNSAYRIEVTTAGSMSHVRLDNTPYYENFNGASITVNVFAKSSNTKDFKLQIKANQTGGTTKNYTSGKFNTTSSYPTNAFSYTFNLDSVDTDYITLRIQAGDKTGTIDFDDWTSVATGVTLSNELVGFEKDLVSVYYSENRVFIDGPYLATQVIVINTLGAVVKKSIGDTESVKVDDLPKGVYIVKAFLEGNKSITKKLVIN